MPGARPEFAMQLAAIGLLLAIGVSSIQRGATVLGIACLAAAAATAAWLGVRYLRSRG